MKKSILFILTAAAAICLSLGLIFAPGVTPTVGAEATPGVTPTLSVTKYLTSRDGKYLLLATGINDFEDTYEVGYEISDGLDTVVAVTNKYYKYITIGANARTWKVAELFPGYSAMIVWEVKRDLYSDVSFKAYARVGERDDGALYTTDVVEDGTEKELVIDRSSYTTATKAKSEYPTLDGGQTVANWHSSSQMLVFDYKWSTDNSDGTDYAQIQLWGTSNQLSGNLRLKHSDNQIDTSYLGRTVGLANGWRQFRARLCDLTVNGDYGSETLTRIKISSGHRYDILIDNIRVEDVKDSDMEVALDGTYSVANGGSLDIALPDYDKNMMKTLEMDIDLTDDSGTDKFYIGLYDETTHYYGTYRFQVTQLNTTYAMDGLYVLLGKSGSSTYKNLHVVFNLSELNAGSNTKPSKLFHIKNPTATTAGTISNVKFSAALPSFDLDSTFDRLYVSPNTVASAKILSFDLSIPSNGDLRYFLTDSSSSVRFGEYRFYPAYKDGKNGETAVTAGARNGTGVTYSEIGTNLYHLEYDLGSLSGGSGTPTTIYSLWNNGSKNYTDGYNKISNIKWLDSTNYTVSVTNGTVSVTNGSDSGKYNSGEIATVVAGEYTDKRFKEWQIGGEKVSDSPTYSFAVSGNTSITAVYDDICTIDVTEGFGGGVYDVGDEVTVVANEKYERFVGWKDGDGHFVSGSKTYTFTASESVSLTAHYGKVDIESGFDIPLPDYDEDLTDILALEFDVCAKHNSSYARIYWNLCDASGNYFGWYRITYAGKAADDDSGYSVESIGTDTYHVTLVLSELVAGSGTPGKLVKIKDSGSSYGDLTGSWIDNIEFTYAKVALTSGYEIVLPDYDEENAGLLAFGMDVHVEDSSSGKLGFGLYDENDKYYGKYRFTYAGFNANYNGAGVEVENIGTRTWHMTFTLALLSGGSSTAPGKLITLKDIDSESLDGSWIRYTGFEPAKTGTVTVVGGTGGGEYVIGSSVTIERNSGSDFIGWKDGNGDWVKQNGEYVLSDSLTFTLTEDVTYTAVFGPYTISNGFEIPLPDYDENYSNILALEFDVYAKKNSSYARVCLDLCDESGNFFGYYRVTYAGIAAANVSGYSAEKIGTDTYHVTFVLKDLVKGSSGAPGKLVKIKDSSAYASYGDLTGSWIDNITWNYTEVSANAVAALDVPDSTAQVLKTASAPVSRETTVLFSGAKGERETAQMTLYATSGIANKEFDVTFTDFVGTAGTIPSSAVETSMFGYINVDGNFFTDPANYDLPFGEFPDWMLPLSVAKGAGENVLNVSSGNNQGLYFVLNIPSTANKGTYYGYTIIEIEGSLPMCLPVEIDVFGFALPAQHAAKVMMNIRNDHIKALYTEYEDDDDSNAMYTEIQSELAARGISAPDISGTVYSSGTINNRYIANLKKAAADPKITVYKLRYNYDVWSSIQVSGTAYNWNGSTKALSNEDLGGTRLPRVYDVVTATNTYYGLIGLFTKIADESTNELDLFKKAIIVAPYDEHYGVTQEIQILLCKYAVYFSRDRVLADYDWTGKLDVKASLQNLRFIVAMAPVPSLYTGDTIRVTAKTAPTDHGQTVDGSWMPTSNTTIKLDGIMTEVFKFDLLWGDTDIMPYSVPNSDAILEKELDPATEDDYLVYWYTPVGGDKSPHWASLSINASVLDYRVNYWQTFKRGIDGVQYWSVANTYLYVPHFTATKDSKVQSGKKYYQADATALYGYRRVYPAVNSSASGLYEYNYNSTTEEPEEMSETYILAHGTHFQGCYGEGTLVYMVRDTYGEYGANILTTLRLENVAEAIDDYNYLAYAQSLIDDVADADTKAEYQATFDSLFGDLFDLTDGSGNTTTCAFKADGNDLKNARAQLAELIETILA